MSERIRTRHQSQERRNEEKPVWLLGSAGGFPEVLTGILVVAVALAALWLEPGFSRPLRHCVPVACGLTGGLAAYFILRHQLQARARLTLYTLAGWYLWSIFSSFQTVDAFRSQQTLVNWATGASLFLLTSVGFSSGKAWRNTIILLTAGAAFYCLLAVAGKSPGQPLMGCFTNRDTFSVIPMLGTFLSLSCAYSASTGGKLLAFFFSLIFALITVMSGSRAGALGIAVGAAAWLASLAMARDRRMFKTASRYATLGGFILLLGGVASNTLLPLLARFGEVINGADIQGVTMRRDVVYYGLEASRKHPSLGSGPGTFALAYQAFRPAGAVPDYIFVNYAHNDYMEMLVEVGWPGLLLWLAFGSLVVVRGIRLIRFSIATWECSCLIAAICALAAFSALNFILPVTAVFLWEMLILGLLQGLPSGSPVVRRPPLAQKLIALLIFSASIICSVSSYAFLRAALLVNQAKLLGQALRWEDSTKVLDKALKWQPNQVQALTERGRYLTKMGLFSHQPELTKRGESSLSLASQISPLDQDVSSAQIQYYSAAGQYAQAEKVLAKAHENAPYQEWHLPTLARLQVLQGRYDRAVQSIYAVALEREKLRQSLPLMLYELESRQPRAAVQQLEQWCSQEGEVGISLKLAKSTAAIALEKKNPKIAGPLLELVMTKDPDDSESVFLLSKVYGLQGKPKEESALLKKLASRAESRREDPFVDEALIKLAESSSPPDSKVFESLEARRKRFPKSIPLSLAVSRQYLNQQKPEEAGDVIAAILNASGEDPELLARMGTCLAAQGLRELAMQYFQQSLKLRPSQAEARTGLRKLLSNNQAKER